MREEHARAVRPMRVAWARLVGVGGALQCTAGWGFGLWYCGCRGGGAGAERGSACAQVELIRAAPDPGPPDVAGGRGRA
jgi:hypothetical protein